MHTVKIKDIEIAQNKPLVMIAGPCQLESLEHSLVIASHLKEISLNLNIPFIFKGSFDKANRSSHLSPRGVGIEKGLEILATVKEKIDCPVITDVHSEKQCEQAAAVVDILQIPAFLCRQTDLLTAAARTKKVVNIKKGQFLSPMEVANITAKIEQEENQQILLCERGTSFGYNNLVSDFRSIAIMSEQTRYPVIFDATHSVQTPGGNGTSSGGQRKFVPLLARAAVAVKVAGVFIETHQDPDSAPSDGPNMVNIKDMENLMSSLKKIDQLVKSLPDLNIS
jgi:2-dehydro-3-deoxyphosphooctonate aldolase (KDO 8-P synthase)